MVQECESFNVHGLRIALMFARKIRVDLVDPQGARACPAAWLDSFCMRSFTGRSAFDETLPISDGLMEASFRVDLPALQADMEDWLTRKFGEGKPVKLSLREEVKVKT
jgi:hypothetical protein